MPTDVVMPQMGESITEGTITKWLKKPGDTIQRDEPLFEISTDKVDAEIPSPSAGTLKEIKIAEGTTVQINTVVATIDEAGSASAAATAAASPAKAETAAAPAADTATPTAVDTPAAVQGNAPTASGPGTDVLMPQMGESITEGTITKWLKKVGDNVQRDEPIFEISTDKVDAEIEELHAKELVLIGEIRDSALTFHMRGLAPEQWRMIIKTWERKIKPATKSEDDIQDATNNRNRKINAEIIGTSVVKVVNAKGGTSKGAITTEAAEKLYDVLLESEYQRLLAQANQLTFTNSLFHNMIAADADFLSES